MSKELQAYFALDHESRVFIDTYLIYLDEAKAYLRIKPNTKAHIAKARGKRLLARPDIAAALTERQLQRNVRMEIAQDRILAEVVNIAFLDIIDFFNDDGSMKALKDIPESARRAIASFEVEEIFAGKGAARVVIGQTKKVKMLPKVQTLELLGKHIGAFKDTVEHTGTINHDHSPVTVYLPENGRDPKDEG